MAATVVAWRWRRADDNGTLFFVDFFKMPRDQGGDLWSTDGIARAEAEALAHAAAHGISPAAFWDAVQREREGARNP
jgi:hypothetical protein